MESPQKNRLSGSQIEIMSDDPRFPAGLLHVQAPPVRVCLLGDLSLLSQPALAIVGARKASPYGLDVARHFARLAALRAITVVSGGAIGCDQAAHHGALEAKGRTVVVLGCGADVIYPAGARGLFERIIAEGGTLLSEAPWGSPPSKWGFRRRNRLIAGLAQATLIVEAGLPSGTFSTADATLAQGKDVLAIPGSIFAPESRGANRLIAQGAVPVVDDTSFEDALTAIFGPPEYRGTPRTTLASAQATVQARHSAAPPQDPLLSTLSQQPCVPERLIGICGENVVEVIRCLSALELAGTVVRLRDGRYTLKSFC